MNIEQRISDYLKYWIRTDGYCELALAESRGLLLIMIETILDSSAINPDLCYEECRQIEREIINYKYTKEELENEYKEFHKNLEVWIDRETNEHAFIPVNCVFVDYLTDQKELFSQGFIFSNGYDNNGNEYKISKLHK